MPSQPSPPKTRSSQRPTPTEMKRADKVLDSMFISVKLPKPSERPESDEPAEQDTGDESLRRD